MNRLSGVNFVLASQKDSMMKLDGNLDYLLSSMEGSKSDTWHPAIEYDNDTLSLLDILSDRDKDIVIRHTVNDETFASIAESYNVSGMSVCKWHQSALETLKERSV